MYPLNNTIFQISVFICGYTEFGIIFAKKTIKIESTIYKILILFESHLLLYNNNMGAIATGAVIGVGGIAAITSISQLLTDKKYIRPTPNVPYWNWVDSFSSD